MRNVFNFLINFHQMVADLSHWVCVAETNASDPDLTAVVEKYAGQFRHTHCRSVSVLYFVF